MISLRYSKIKKFNLNQIKEINSIALILWVEVFTNGDIVIA